MTYKCVGGVLNFSSVCSFYVVFIFSEKFILIFLQFSDVRQKSRFLTRANRRALWSRQSRHYLIHPTTGWKSVS